MVTGIPFRLAMVLLVVAAAACAPGRRAAAPGATEEVVEVSNFSRDRVEVHYYSSIGQTPQYLGSVGAGDRQRFTLPRGVLVTSVFATGPGGGRIYGSSAIRIRRIRP